MSNSTIEDDLFEIEALIDKLANKGLQKGDILKLVEAYIDVHRPDCIEEYTDGSNPVMVYGHYEYVFKLNRDKK